MIITCSLVISRKSSGLPLSLIFETEIFSDHYHSIIWFCATILKCCEEPGILAICTDFREYLVIVLLMYC